MFVGGDIKINVEDTRAPKLPLFYVSNTVFGKWILIQENWINGILPESFGNTLKKFGDVENDSNEEEVTQKKRRAT